jgi:hypothetical protein
LEQGIIEKVELMANLLLRVGVCSGKLEENCIFKVSSGAIVGGNGQTTGAEPVCNPLLQL